MGPKHHADYLARWAKMLEVPILSVDYRKAPEHPYPSAFNDWLAQQLSEHIHLVRSFWL